MQRAIPLTRDLVLVGGGHTHALVLRMWGMKPLPGVRLTVIDPGVTAAYSGMLPGHVAGHYTREELDIDLVKLARFAGARVILDRAVGLDPVARVVRLQGRPAICYDMVSLDVGITSHLNEVAGFAEHAVPAKPLGVFAAKWQAFLDRAVAGEEPAEVAIMGAGVAGVELALAMDHALRARGVAQPKVTLVDRSTPLNGVGKGARHVLEQALEKAGITLIAPARVSEVTARALVLEGGQTLPAHLVIGAGGARPHPWLADCGLELHEGFVTVDETLRAKGQPLVYAVGDCNHMAHAPRPKAGVYAVRQAPILFHNLRADLAGGTHKPYHPQRDYLKLVSLGDKRALADKAGLRLAGKGLWRLKDRIDRAFMDKFTNLPVMSSPTLPTVLAAEVRGLMSGTQAPCGGCGAKVAPATLRKALSGHQGETCRTPRADVIRLPGDDAAEVVVGGQRQVLSADHLRAFTLDAWVMAKIAAIHALGDVWAMGATPQAALSMIILPQMTPRLQARTLEEVLEAAEQVFAEAGAEIVGGHTTLGDEMTLGFTVTGLSAARTITLKGAVPGDRFIVTKPIGSGTIMAAEMMGRAKGAWFQGAFEHMLRPSGNAAQVLRDANAMTDITGFGLAGHLMGILRASGCHAEVDLDAVPLMEGAAELAALGLRSTLEPGNRADFGADVPDRPAGHLLFDPQTAGGLLAAVAADQADAVLRDLRAAGHPAAIIGEVTEGAPGITFR